MTYCDNDCPIGEEPAYEVRPGPDGTFKFSHHGHEVTQPRSGELSPETQANRQMIEETYRRLTGLEPPELA